MLGKIWFALMAAGFGWSLLQGEKGAFLQAAVSAGEASLSYGLKLAGILGFWLGIMEVAKRAGRKQPADQGPAGDPQPAPDPLAVSFRTCR